MKISDIKTELFTRVTITDYGIRFEIFDRALYGSDKADQLIMNSIPVSELFKDGKIQDKKQFKSLFILTIHLQKHGGMNLQGAFANKMSADQIDEVQRISKILRSIL